jgi:hypothetical protein
MVNITDERKYMHPFQSVFGMKDTLLLYGTAQHSIAQHNTAHQSAADA